MKLSPRAKLLAVMSLFALPMAASFITYRYFPPQPTANYGELLLPPATVTAQSFETAGAEAFEFQGLRGKWVLVASDSGDCPAACGEKLHAMNQVRLALGRNAARVHNVFVIDDRRVPAASFAARYPGLTVATRPRDAALPGGAGNDRDHIYLVDTRGNVMMRWPSRPQFKPMLRDLERLLKASQIG